MMSDKEDNENVNVPDKRYRQLSYQLFGDPTKSQQNSQGPFVDLTGKPRGQDFVPSEIKKVKPRKPRPTDRKTDRPPRNHSGFVGRCLICYSLISRTERFKFLGNKLAELDNMKKEKSDNLIELLRIMAEPVHALHRNLDAARSISAIFELALKRLVTRPWVFCVTCNAACDRLLVMHRAMKKLEAEVKEFQVKFLNAIKLSKALAEKDPQANMKGNEDEDKEENSSSKKDTRTKLSLPMKTVNQVRTCFVGGKWMWGLMKKDWVNYVNLDTEVVRNPEPLEMLNMRVTIKQEKLEEPCTCKCTEHISSKRRKRKSVKGNQNQKIVDGLKVAAQNSDTNIVKRLKAGPLSKTRNETSLEDSLISPSIKVESNVQNEINSDQFPGPENMANSFGGDDNFFEDDDAIELNDLPDDDPLKITLGPAGKVVKYVGKDKNQRDTNSLNQFAEEHDVTNNPSNKTEASADTDGKSPPKKLRWRGPRKHSSKPLSMTPEAIRFRELRAKYPNLTSKELRANLRTLPNRHKKGIPGPRRKPIEELKQTESNKKYIEWRKTHGRTMSLTAYNEMKRKQIIEQQKITEAGGLPGRAHKGSGGIRTNWINKDDGTLSYLGVQVNRKEDGTLSCSLCDFVPVNQTKAKEALAHHIKGCHTGLSNGYSCEKCDEKFFYHHQLTIHQAKHEGLQCPLCGMTFRNRSGLFCHDRVKHRGIKPHVCEHCGKEFATVKDKTIHVRRHTGERPFVCHVCAKTFIEKQSMKKHIRKYHPGEIIDEPPKRKIRIGDNNTPAKSQVLGVVESLSQVEEKVELNLDPTPSTSQSS